MKERITDMRYNIRKTRKLVNIVLGFDLKGMNSISKTLKNKKKCTHKNLPKNPAKDIAVLPIVRPNTPRCVFNCCIDGKN